MFTAITGSVSRKLTLTLFAILLVFSAVSAYLSYQSVRGLYLQNIKTIHETDAVTTNLVKAFITGAIAKQKAGGDMKNDEGLKTLSSVLSSMSEKDLVDNAYVLYPDVVTEGGKEFLQVVGTGASLEKVLPPMSKYELTDVFKKGVEELNQTELVLTDSYTDANGTYISSLSKITDDKGNVIAIFGLDFNFGDVQKQLNKEVVHSIITAVILGVVFSCLIWLIITRELVPFKELTIATNRAANGDFSFQMKVTRKDEFGRLKQNFNTMLANVSALLRDVADSTKEVVSASQSMYEGAGQSLTSAKEIARSVQEVAAGSEAQMQSTEETKRAVGEMTAGVQRIAESAGDVTEYVFSVSAETGANQKLMAGTVEQMERINESVQAAVQQLERLLERSADITGIVGVITDIANQTNLLALNASIEAARAGEQGRGFAVVAGEIRKLAEQSRISSENIAQLIHAINEDTREIAQSMSSGAEEATSGAEIVRKAHEGFDRIAESMQSITAQVQEISAATEQLSASSEEISATMEELARISEQSSGSSQEVAASVEQQLGTMDAMAASARGLKSTADKVKAGVSKFTV
ncbi:methyl-accepting chemotaxis protein [Paenibacillus allorhizosphaerae]|uniref:Methyl-accepting chemotaxis protein n=1 Tax=Paenibacillus allorhizosphaerae TaxID=2849866 RepID=A0ABM8VF95_9BACL|nr:HAMP domain-containing methyl-accepting chemotaxis protein [Paenibacillus allorhizosphaerae]CAG7634174.1 hypothetical protein PAECIP111802_02022 [Paenibacillus allorhizosphaerae]